MLLFTFNNKTAQHFKPVSQSKKIVIVVTGEGLALRTARYTCTGHLRWTLSGVW